jgi:molybdate transport system permease protein
VWLAALPLVCYLVAPIAGLVLRTSLHSYLCCGEALTALRISLFTATIALGGAILIGTPVAYLLSHYQFRGKEIIDTLVDLPLVLPPVAAGLALLLLYGRQGLGSLLAQHDLRLSFTLTAVIMAQLFIASPFYVKQARAGFEAVPANLRLASATLGAGPLRTFFKVTAPLARNSLIAGAVMTWARALGEFGATLVFAGSFPGRTETMPVAIYNHASASGPQGLRTSIALAVILVAVSFAVILVARRLAARTVSPAPQP